MISRRTFLANAAYILSAPLINRGRSRLAAQSEREYSLAAIDLVRSSTVIDMLGLLTLDYRKLMRWQTEPGCFQAADLERLKASGITIFHPAVGFTEGDVYGSSLKDLTGWNAFMASHEDSFLRVDGPADLERVKSLDKIGIILGLQNSGHFRSVDDVDHFYALGQRVSQLTYLDNLIGGGSTDPRDPGLSAYGARIVQRMNRLGMAIDVSHCGDRTTLDAIEASGKPVLVTHSNCRALVRTSARCKTDAAIRKMAAKGGVMGITMVRFFVGEARAVTIEDVLNHIDHIAALAGIEHVGLGTDVDLDGRHRIANGRNSNLDGIQYLNKIYELTEGLLRRNYSSENIRLVLGGNFQRALSSIWQL